MTRRVVLNAALANAVAALFSNTGPTGQRALAVMTKKMTSPCRRGRGPGHCRATARR